MRPQTSGARLAALFAAILSRDGDRRGRRRGTTALPLRPDSGGRRVALRRSEALILGLTALLAGGAVPSHGRETVGSTSQRVSGQIKDALGRGVPEATVTLRAGGRRVATTQTGGDGRFRFDDVPPGDYEIVVSSPGFKTRSVTAAVGSAKPSEFQLSLEAEEALTLPVVTRRLDVARNRLSPRTGGSVYHLTEEAVKSLPQGQNSQFNQVLLQAPGVSQDSFGQLHIRDDHGNVQYRIDGIQLPEGISTFSQGQSPRFAKSVDLLTGALPAQYGFRTAAVVDIKTKSGSVANGGGIEMYGGQRGTIQPSFDVGASHGNLSVFMTGQFFRSSRGIEPPTSRPDPIHDQTEQGNFFAYLSYVPTSSTRISLISGTTVADFEIPATPGKTPAFTLAGVNDADANAFPSIAVKETQFEQNYYNVLSLQGTLGSDLSYQIAPFSRYSAFEFRPDEKGDLIYTGIASHVFRSDLANGVQGDASFALSEAHTLRAGFYVSGESARADNRALVFPTDSSGNQSSNVPVRIVDDNSKVAWLYDVYLQDEWKPTEKATIDYGLRLDLSDQFTRSSEASPRVGLVYRLFDSTTLHTAYARYFTPPPTELVSTRSVEKFANTTNASAVTENSPIRPERSHYFDAGVVQRVLPGLTVGLDGYYKRARDLLDEGQFGSAIVFSPFNYARGYVYGTEVTASYSAGDLSAYVNYGFAKAKGERIESGEFLFRPDELAFARRHYVHLDHDQLISGSMGASYRWKDVLFSVDAIHGSGLRSGTSNRDHLPAYVQIDGSIGRTFEPPGLVPFELRIAAVNLLDRTYEIRDGTGIGVQAAQFGPRRAVYAGIRIPFSFGRNG